MDFCAEVYTFLVSLVFGICSVSGFLSDCDPQTCGRPDVQPVSSRIVGGQESRPGSLPWMAILTRCQYMKCGGAILNHQFIITAAHCFDEPEYPCFSLDSKDTQHTSNWTVYLGKHDVLRSNKGERMLEVERIIVHPLYDNRTQHNDLALVKVKGSITYTSLIKPVCLASLATVPAAGRPCLVAGYGETFTVNQFTLHQVTVPVISDQQCSQPDWYGTNFYPPQQFCAGFESGGRDACVGDSGSPLICRFEEAWYINGIVSKGTGCAQPKQPGIYTNVSFYEFWILTTMAEHGVLPTCR